MLCIVTSNNNKKKQNNPLRVYFLEKIKYKCFIFVNTKLFYHIGGYTFFLVLIGYFCNFVSVMGNTFTYRWSTTFVERTNFSFLLYEISYCSIYIYTHYIRIYSVRNVNFRMNFGRP